MCSLRQTVAISIYLPCKEFPDLFFAWLRFFPSWLFFLLSFPFYSTEPLVTALPGSATLGLRSASDFQVLVWEGAPHLRPMGSPCSGRLPSSGWNSPNSLEFLPSPWELWQSSLVGGNVILLNFILDKGGQRSLQWIMFSLQEIFRGLQDALLSTCCKPGSSEFNPETQNYCIKFSSDFHTHSITCSSSV